MRKIVFRGMRMEDGEWVYGHLVTLNGVVCIFDNGKSIEVVEETVGQWTGLYDKNGVKIFEGDIVDCNCYTVSYVADVNESKGMHAGWFVQRHIFEGWYELECHEGHTVLGNPWENPELMK